MIKETVTTCLLTCLSILIIGLMMVDAFAALA